MDSSRLQSIVGVNDTVYRFKFISSWQGTIYAGLHGCKVLTDSLKISSPSMALASDTGFCKGGSVLLNAGSGFLSYEWNTGSNEQNIIVSTEGEYSIKATTSEGCEATDTIKVKQFAVPVAGLDKNPNLCFGEVRTLDAGNFNSYEWNTGESARTIQVSGVGVYAVTVTDTHGCIGSDTAAIKAIVPLPTGFLPADTTICSYRPIALMPLKDYASYLWNNGAITKSITVSQPGVYWLQVTDANTCIGKDTIVLNLVNCVQGFFVPNAFTPNKDGRNDDFKPFLFGPVDQYEFTVYNRAGEVVFKSYEVNEGWNGNYKGVPQDSGLFVWICKYRFSGEKGKAERGTVMLLK